MSNPESFEIDRFRLRPLREADVDDPLECHADPEVIRYIPWTRRSRYDVSG
jgi:RimJ/RimL family protein N-acetyltransferase